jgi:hypothetical protein
MRCSSCDFENAAGKKFCIRCGVAFGVRCSKRNCENTPEASFCGDCGDPLEKGSAAVDRRPSSGSAAQPQRPTTLIQSEVADTSKMPDGERKTVTALFADIKGSYTQGQLHGIWWLRVSISEPSSAITGTVRQLRRID